MSLMSALLTLIAAAPGPARSERDPNEIVCRVTQPAGTRIGRMEQCFARKDWAVFDAAAERGDMVASTPSGERPTPIETPLALAEGRTSIGYATISAALQDLRSRPHVIFESRNEWTVATDAGASTTWFFAPAAVAGHPAMIKRRLVPQENGSRTETSVRCEAAAAICREIVQAFAQQNGINIAAPSPARSPE
jgi:hypothetical protein